MSVEVDGVPLSPGQTSRWERLLRAARSAGAVGPGAAEAAAADSWKILYRAEGGAWVRKDVAVTSRGFSFPQRPGESVAQPGGPALYSQTEEAGAVKILLQERSALPSGSYKVLLPGVVAEAAAPGEEPKPLPAGVLMRVEAVLGQVDTVNRNGRIYPRETMVRELKAAKGGSIKDRSMFALADHPGGWFSADPPSGSTRKIAGIQSEAYLKGPEDPNVYGCIDIIDTDDGRDIAAVVRAGGAIGISQRGYGSVAEDVYKDAAGRRVVAGIVQPDYHLEAWDFVLGPSADAGVVGYTESADPAAAPGAAMEITLENLRAHHPALIAAIKAEESARLEAASATALAEARTAAAAEAKAAGISEGKAAAEASAAPDVALAAAVRETAGSAVTDHVAWVKDLSPRAAAGDVAKADLETKVSEARAPGAKSAALIKVISEKAGGNVRVVAAVLKEAFGPDGAPLLATEALEARIAAELKGVAKPADAPPGPGAGRTAEEDASSTTDAERLSEVNKMRASAGLPELTTLSPAGA